MTFNPHCILAHSIHCPTKAESRNYRSSEIEKIRFKAAIINIVILPNFHDYFHVIGVTHDEPIENYHPTLRILSALWSISASFSSVLLHSRQFLTTAGLFFRRIIIRNYTFVRHNIVYMVKEMSKSQIQVFT